MKTFNFILASGIILIVLFAIMPIVSAGVGIKWNQESSLVKENEKTCMTYSVYNPWPKESYVTIEVSDELKQVITSQEAESKLVPANTASTSAIPIKFCFKVPAVYSDMKICKLGIICKQTCPSENKEYSGEVLVKSIPKETSISGSGGSATQMAVSAPLRLRVRCDEHGYDYTFALIILAVISALIIALLLFLKYRKPKAERNREKLRKLQEEIRREKRKK